jgi:chromosomal replication initiator protein
MVDAPAPDPQAAAGHAPSASDRIVLRELLQQLGSGVRREQLETWFRSLDVRRIDDQEIELSVTSQFVRDWLQKNFLPTLQEAVAALGEPRRRHHPDPPRRGRLRQPAPRAADDRLGRNGPTACSAPATRACRRRRGSWLGIGGWDRLPAARSPADSSPADSAKAKPVHRRSRRAARRRRSTPTARPSASSSARATGSRTRRRWRSARTRSCAYNPLFLHGNVGLGKSHLLQAICHTIQRRDPKARVALPELRRLHQRLHLRRSQSHTIDAFRDYYRTADVLVIDDVQFLANKDKTQDEFFHTFNALYDAQKQIVLSSDRPPVEIPTVEERLVSRFKWGLVAEVEAPRFDTRVAIVKRKAAGRGIELPDDVARFLAERVTTNIRELEGAVIKIVGIAAITDQPMNLSLAESCVRGMPVRHAQVSVDDDDDAHHHRVRRSPRAN